METNNNNTVLYIHTRKSDGGIFYVGIGSKQRSTEIRSRNKYWYNVVNKYDYDVKILKTEMSWKKACELEIKMIAFYGRKDKKKGSLVNMTDGGDGSKGCNPSKETKQKIALKRKQIIKNSNDSNVFGVKGFGLGKIDSIETRSKKVIVRWVNKIVSIIKLIVKNLRKK